MTSIQIEGIATITDKGFHFDSGMPSNEPVIKAAKMHGTLKVSENANVDFEDNGHIYLAPQWYNVSQGNGYHVKRTSRNYIIQLKVPVVESRAVTQQRLDEIMPTVMGDIVIDRREALSEAIDN